MKNFKVYLAGPIAGLPFEGSTGWREEAKQRLWEMSDHRIEGYSPMRSKEYLKSEGIIVDTYEQTILSSSRGIMTRDFFDCQSSDAIFVNLLCAEKVSIGTVMEIAWGYAFRKPIILCMDEMEFKNIHDHSMIREAVGFRTPNFELALETVCKVLLP